MREVNGIALTNGSRRADRPSELWADETVLVPVLDDIDSAEFSGDYVLSAEHAWTAVKDFLRHGAVEDLGEWQEL